MKKELEELKDITSECCVTIIIRTHPDFPDNEKDPIELKNAIREAGQRLHTEYDKQLADSIAEKINKLAESIDLNQNSESLALFVNEKIAKSVRLPIKVSKRVVIDKTFMLRPLIRAIQREAGYYVLTLSREKARLIEALNGKLTKEFEDNFPMTNTFDVPVAGGTAQLPIEMDSLVREFFINVDKQLNEIEKQHPLPVIICTDGSNYAEYFSIAQRKELIAGHFDGNRDNEKAKQIIEEVWPLMQKIHAEKNHGRLSELSAAISAGNLVTGIDEIWRAIGERRGRTLFVKQGYFQPVKFEKDQVMLLSPDTNDVDNEDDIIDLMIEKNIEFGGDVVFITGEDLKEFDNVALVARY